MILLIYSWNWGILDSHFTYVFLFIWIFFVGLFTLSFSGKFQIMYVDGMDVIRQSDNINKPFQFSEKKLFNENLCLFSDISELLVY